MTTITAKGRGVTAEFDGTTITLTHGGFFSQVGRCVKRIPLRQINAVHWKSAGPRGGLIQFEIAGGVENRAIKGGGQITQARKDPNSATFAAGKEEAQFKKFRAAVEAAMAAPPAATADPPAGDVVSQLERLTALRDAGAVSPAEFDTAKTRLLAAL